MDIKIFEDFLATQREAFKCFLVGCGDLDRQHMRIALDTHSSKMTFALTTQYPILGIGPSVAPNISTNSTPRSRSTRRPFTSPYKSPSPPPFQSPATIPDIPRIPSIFKRKSSSSAATPPASTTRMNSNTASTSATKSVSGHLIRKDNIVLRRTMTIGGAATIFKSLPSTPKKSYASDYDIDSSAASAASDESYSPTRKRNTKGKEVIKGKGCKLKVTSPFENAARKREAKERQNHESDSTSNSEIELKVGKGEEGQARVQYPIRKVTAGSVRSIESVDGLRERQTPAKGAGTMVMRYVDGESENEYGDYGETPYKRQKIYGAGPDKKAATEID